MEDVGEQMRKRVKQLRKEAGLTQKQLAERVDLNYKHFQEIEGGAKTNIRLSTIERLAQALEINITQLFEDRSCS